MLTISSEYYETILSPRGLNLPTHKFPIPVREGLHLELPSFVHCSLTEVRRVGAFSIIRPNGRASSVSVGRYCSIAPGVYMGAPEHELTGLSISSVFSVKYGWLDKHRPFPARGGLVDRSTTIGNDVWIGNGAYIKPGVTIHDGAVVGARSVVTKDVPPYAVVVGNPGRQVKQRFPDSIIADLLDLQWWDYEPSFLNNVDTKNVEAVIEYVKDNKSDLSTYSPAYFFAHSDRFGIVDGASNLPSDRDSAGLRSMAEPG